MRTIFYSVFNKETGKREYTSIDKWRCEKYIEQQQNKENYRIGGKWYSV